MRQVTGKYVYNVDLEIPDDMVNRLNDWELENTFALTKNLKLIKGYRFPVYDNRCTNYAFKQKGIFFCEDAFYLLTTDYFPVLVSQVRPGDIVSFHDCFCIPKAEKFAHEHNAQHFGIVTQAGRRIKDIRIKSKWGTMGIYETDLKTLPEMYGDVVVFWRKKEEPKMQMKFAEIKTKEEAREEAQKWQAWQSEQSLSYGELLKWETYFGELAKKFDLVEEFRENGII